MRQRPPNDGLQGEEPGRRTLDLCCVAPDGGQGMGVDARSDWRRVQSDRCHKLTLNDPAHSLPFDTTTNMQSTAVTRPLASVTTATPRSEAACSWPASRSMTLATRALMETSNDAGRVLGWIMEAHAMHSSASRRKIRARGCGHIANFTVNFGPIRRRLIRQWGCQRALL